MEPRNVSSQMEEAHGPKRGYPQVATFMGNNPEMAMVRRFGGLNARNILYLQAELMLLEEKLLKCEEKDANDPVRCSYSIDYYPMLDAWNKEGQNTQWLLIQEMRKKLKEYSKSPPLPNFEHQSSFDAVLIQQTALANLPPPSNYDRKTMQHWFSWDQYAAMPLKGDDAVIWADPENPNDCESRYKNDLIAISPGSDDIDRVTEWVSRTFVPNWNQRVMNSLHKGVRVVHESSVYMFTAIVATMLSSLLPIGSIVVLYFVHNTPARLGIIAGFTALFSIAISLVTSAARVENFAATAAFAAVQVVFVGTTNGTSSA